MQSRTAHRVLYGKEINPQLYGLRQTASEEHRVIPYSYRPWLRLPIGLLNSRAVAVQCNDLQPISLNQPFTATA